MDPQSAMTQSDSEQCSDSRANAAERALNRRRALKLGLGGLACATCGGALIYHLGRRASMASAAEVFRGDAPSGIVWENWKRRGWAKEASHYLMLGTNIQCKLCPNACLLEPEDRGHCRGRVHKDGKLYSLSYGNACTMHPDPVEKKPLFHYLPGTSTFSFAATGCGLRCLNCQNWDISQRKPEELKDPRGDELRLSPSQLHSLSSADMQRGSLLPDDVVAFAQYFSCPSVSYTYSEPAVWFEYVRDCAMAVRQAKLKNILVTSGYIQQEPLEELCNVLDAAHVDLKSFDEDIYAELNSGRLAPILQTIQTLQRRGVWFEVINLVVPSYTDKPEMIREMCDWLVARVGPDVPLHFSRFTPMHKLTHLLPTPVESLLAARETARAAGLHYVYIGNCAEIADGETTCCPKCRKPVVERHFFAVDPVGLKNGTCNSCGTIIAGTWST